MERRDALEAIILTHGHEDHIGAVPFLLRAVGQVPIYGRRFTLALLRPKLDEHRLLEDAELIEVAVQPSRSRSGPSRAEFIPLTHSTPDCAAVALETAGRHDRAHRATSASSTRPSAGGAATCPPSRAWATAACGLLLADSTNAEEGPTGSPLPMRDVKNELVRHLRHRPRPRAGDDLLVAHPPRAAGAGRRIRRRPGRRAGGPLAHPQRRTASNLMDPDTGRPYLTPPPGTLVRLRELEAHPRDEQVLICTGSQGEPMAALSRIARGEHNQVTIEPGDTVLYSSSTVPGNELAVNEIVNRLVRADAEFITERQNPRRPRVRPRQRQRPAAHAGAAAPRASSRPIHGEARHQRAHADLARGRRHLRPDRVHILDNGDVLEVTPTARRSWPTGCTPG